MEIKDLLKTEVMILDLKANSKEAAIDEMVNKLVSEGYVSDFDTFKAGIMKREAQTSTGLGDGIAMPHSKNIAVNEPVVLFAKSKTGVDYAALDGQPVNLFFMIAAPDGANDTHLEALAQLSTYLLKDGFQDRLRKVEYPRQVIELFSEKQEEVQTVENAEHYIVAVTACTTGIAHTYMAEEALKKQALEMGVGIKIETNGARGIDNKLTDEDIKKADAVIVAADKKVEMNRFAGKQMVQVPVAHAIRETEHLIDEALSGKAPIYKGDGSENTSAQSSSSQQTMGQKFYKHLMGGVSAMLPFVVGGGIMIALAFLIDQLMGVPQSQLSQLGVYHPIAYYFKTIGGAAFNFMLPVLAGFIAQSIADKPGLVAGFVAGYMAQIGISFQGFAHTNADKYIPSGFLGALVGGFLAGGVILLLRKWFKKMPASLEGIKAILLFPLLGVFITGFLMLFVNIPMAWINTGLSNFLTSLSGASALILGIVVGGMMAIDLGGPINKAAYIFGTGTLTSAALSTGGSIVMACVMAGGMVPPLATTVAVLLFKNKFTKEERNAGLTNIVMGLSFITEGSIPFGAGDPGRAIPSFFVGAAVAGGLVGAAGIKLMAPHGGIFTIALSTNPLLYLLFILVGAVISGVLFGALKKAK